MSSVGVEPPFEAPGSVVKTRMTSPLEAAPIAEEILPWSSGTTRSAATLNRSVTVNVTGSELTMADAEIAPPGSLGSLPSIVTMTDVPDSAGGRIVRSGVQLLAG